MKNILKFKLYISIICILKIIPQNEALISENDNIIQRIPSLIYGNLLKSVEPGKKSNMNTPCTCGIFLDSQLSDDNTVYSNESPAFTKYMDTPLYPCGIRGTKLCIKKCIETVINYMPNIGPLVCASIDRNCVKEKPHLYIKNCDGTWRNTGFSAGKEFCCNKGLETQCRIGLMQQQETNISDLLNVNSISRYLPDFLMNFADRATNIASNVLRMH